MWHKSIIRSWELAKLADIVTISSQKKNGKTIYHASIGQAEAQAETAEDAVIALRRKIKNAFSGGYTIHIISFRGHLGLIWQLPEYYAYSIVSPKYLQEAEGELKYIGSCSLYEKESETQQRLRSHLAQYTWDGEEETSPIIQNQTDQAFFTGWARWQKRYRELQKSGLDDTSIRAQLERERL